MPKDMVVFGGEETLHLTDGKPVTFAVMCEMLFTTDDRGTITASKAFYEFPLLRQTYRRRGGDGEVKDTWLYHPKTGMPQKPRTIPLTRAVLLSEQARLQKNYIYHTQSGVKSIFDDIYGQGQACRFVKVVNDQAKAWNALAQKMSVEGRHRPTIDELTAIAMIADPSAPGEVDIEMVPIYGEPQAEGSGGSVVDLGEDPIGELQSFLVGKDIDPMTAAKVAELHGAKNLTVDTLNQLPELHLKKDAIRDVQSAYAAWLATQTVKVAAATK